MAQQSKLYIVPTDRWYIERSVWLVAGAVLLVATGLAVLVHPLWVLAVAVTAAASIVVALTGFCVVGNVSARLGLRPMLARPGWKPRQHGPQPQSRQHVADHAKAGQRDHDRGRRRGRDGQHP